MGLSGLLATNKQEPRHICMQRFLCVGWAYFPSSAVAEILAAFSPVLGTDPKCFLQHLPIAGNIFLWSKVGQGMDISLGICYP